MFLEGKIRIKSVLKKKNKKKPLKHYLRENEKKNRLRGIPFMETKSYKNILSSNENCVVYNDFSHFFTHKYKL